MFYESMKIEMFVAYTDHTWDTMIVSIESPVYGRDLSISEWEKKVEGLGRSKILLKHQKGKDIAFCGLYHFPAEEEEKCDAEME